MPVNVEKRKEYQANYIRKHYQENKQYYIDKARENKRALSVWFQEYKKTLSCSICGFSHHAALQFHHRDSKETNVSQMINKGSSKENIMKEIEKCDVLCANCHAILHYEQRAAIA